MGRPKGKRNVPDDAILAALPGTATEIGAVVGLTRGAAAWRLGKLRETGDATTTLEPRSGRTAVWVRGGGVPPPSTPRRRGPVRQAGGVLCAVCGAPTSEHTYREVMRGCSR